MTNFYDSVVARRHAADRLFAAGLVCASATARAVEATGLGAPTYVITGRFDDRPDRPGLDDVLTADLIERARTGQPLDADATADAVLRSDEAARTLDLGGDDPGGTPAVPVPPAPRGTPVTPPPVGTPG